MRLPGYLPLGLLLVSCIAPGARAASGDDWLGPDKPKHFAACFTLASAGYAGGALLFDEPSTRWLTGAGLAMGVGVGKELYDWGRGTTFSMKDLAWDAVGTASGLAVAYLVDRLVFRREASPDVARRGSRLGDPMALRFEGAGGVAVRGGLTTRLALGGPRLLLASQPWGPRHQGAALAVRHGDTPLAEPGASTVLSTGVRIAPGTWR